LRRVPPRIGAYNRILVLVRWIRDVDSDLIDIVRVRGVRVFRFVRLDLEQILLSDGSVEASIVVLLDQWAGGSAHT